MVSLAVEKAAAPATANSSAPPDDGSVADVSLLDVPQNAASLEILGVHPNASADLALLVPQVFEKKADGMLLFCESGVYSADESAMAEVWRHEGRGGGGLTLVDLSASGSEPAPDGKSEDDAGGIPV